MLAPSQAREFDRFRWYWSRGLWLHWWYHLLNQLEQKQSDELVSVCTCRVRFKNTLWGRVRGSRPSLRRDSRPKLGNGGDVGASRDASVSLPLRLGEG
ncbi:hypothetical protein BHE74_00047184 [Ensete ventricosum]|uniref:Uncharacterized protein n=1 Tax=Ensete ventricosum TaxID=4639 RepID=A0A444EL91_ENSVE|nr:hypothetical protein GW17_00025340 [Ensete ventricosum]RWW46866.1 hypothetical protein BHE74_00047184 [Ensete ventricosum]RZR75249.1 hypothetical protein BHM03_00052666 [Ensete ventricosum]